MTFPETLVVAAPARATALRYGENPHQAAAFYRTGETAPGRRDRAAAAGQGAVLQQLRRRRRRLRAGRRVRRRRRSRSSSTPTRAASPIGAEPARGLGQGARLRPGQRLRRHRRASTGRSTRPTAEAIAQIFVEVVIAPEAEPRPRAILAAQDGAAAAVDRRHARPGGAAAGASARWPAACWSRSATGSRSTRDELRTVTTSARRARPKSPICCSPTRSQSTSSRTRSSSPATARRSASAPAR